MHLNHRLDPEKQYRELEPCVSMHVIAVVRTGLDAKMTFYSFINVALMLLVFDQRSALICSAACLHLSQCRQFYNHTQPICLKFQSAWPRPFVKGCAIAHAQRC